MSTYRMSAMVELRFNVQADTEQLAIVQAKKRLASWVDGLDCFADERAPDACPVVYPDEPDYSGVHVAEQL